MFVGNRLVYLEMQKTASTKIRAILKDTVGGITYGKHNALDDPTVPFYVAGSVRDPWDWYVSLWAYGCQGQGGIYDRLTRPPVRGPTERLRALRNVRPWEWKSLYEDVTDVVAFRAWLNRVCNPDWAQALNPAFADSPVLGMGGGLMTWRFVRLYAPQAERVGGEGDSSRDQPGIVEIYRRHTILDGTIRMERLPSDLLRVLAEAGYELDDAEIARIHRDAAERTNVSSRGAVQDYYDTESACLVADRERLIVETYGYRPPTSVGESAVS